jgi:hypothetical protein
MQEVRVRLSEAAMHFLNLNETANRKIELSDRLGPARALEISSTVTEALGAGIPISEIPPLTALYFEFGQVDRECSVA